MADKLAGLVLPDATPVEEQADRTRTTGDGSSTEGPAGSLSSRIAGLRKGEWILAAGGVALAGLCAVFPWYIFFHQEQFGVRPLAFSDRQKPSADLLADLADDQPLGLDAMPQLDFAPTGTVPDAPMRPLALAEQPFPGDRHEFRFIHAENGRALIEDDDGFWIVERGSLLPNGSRVADIAQRSEAWVLVTTDKNEIPLSR